MLRHRLAEVLAVLVALLASAWVLTRPDGAASKAVEPDEPPEESTDQAPAPPGVSRPIPAPSVAEDEGAEASAAPSADEAAAVRVLLPRLAEAAHVADARGPGDPDSSLLVTVVRVRTARFVAGARVELASDAGPLASGTTDAKGAIRFASVPVSGVTVRVTREPNFAVTVRRVVPGALLVGLIAPSAVEIRVLDAATGSILRAARVRIVAPRAPSDDPDVLAEGTTDDEGVWRGIVAAPGRVRAIVDTPDGRRVEAWIWLRSSTVTEVRVPIGGRLVGRVVDADGHARSGLIVRLWREQDGRSEPEGGVETAADGSFLLAGLDPDAVYSAVAEGDAGERSEPFRIDAGTRRPVLEWSFRLKPPGTLLVDLTDEAGAPIPDARVTLDGNQYGPDFTQSSRTCEFSRVGIGLHRVHVESSLGPPRDTSVTVVSGPNRVAIRIDGGIRIDGDVLDENGLPAAGTRVLLERAGGDGADAQTRVTTAGASGRFVVGGLAPGAWRVSASAAGATTIAAADVTAPARGVRVRLVRLGRARLQLLREAGGPVEGDVEIRRVRPDGEVVHGSGTLERGSVTIEGFDGAPETLEVSVEGYAPLAKEVRVPAGGLTDLGAWVMRSGHRIAGKVVRAGGLPIQGAAVLVGHHGRVISDKNGDFEFPGVPPGPLELVVVAEDYLHKTLEVDGAAATALRIELSTGAHVAGVVVDVDGKAVGGLGLAFVPTDGSTSGDPVEALRTDEDGSFDVRVPPGRYHVEARPDGDARPVLLVDLTVADGDERTPKLTYRPR